MNTQAVAKTLFTNGSTLLDVDQQPAPQQPAMPTKFGRQLSRRSIRSLSALALIDCSAASPYSSWADSYSCKAAKAHPLPPSRDMRLVCTLAPLFAGSVSMCCASLALILRSASDARSAAHRDDCAALWLFILHTVHSPSVLCFIVSIDAYNACACSQDVDVPANSVDWTTMGMGPNPFALACGDDVASSIVVTLRAPSARRCAL